LNAKEEKWGYSLIHKNDVLGYVTKQDNEYKMCLHESNELDQETLFHLYELIKSLNEFTET
jgi:hypothetical protein